jgi:hypothetical protein
VLNTEYRKLKIEVVVYWKPLLLLEEGRDEVIIVLWRYPISIPHKDSY